ncbi:tetratricopeptide repeat protein [Bifidobacterium felsineum]|uniref:tetratricopeptide repeat protein n=1 Tax=Bifidobacterium felsineum TaxID=2045440 RepID=UPI001BDD8E5D|nr:tetratricopeptide repeat protein [Bifidobacterium felsineum]MBT1164502.1 tetratricopeptide repeat protein [Bifidobacterium felsineum]
MYVEQSIPDDSVFNAQQITAVPKGAKKINGMGTRPLPLLDNKATQAVKDKNAQAVDDAGKAVFGDDWDSTVTTAYQQNSTGGYLRSINAAAQSQIANALQTMDAKKTDDVVNLMGLLASFGDYRANLPYNADKHSDLPGYGMANADYMVIAVSLAYEAPRVFNTCDVQLQSAKVLDLFYPSHGADVISAYDKAATLCGDDATPAVAKIQYIMSMSQQGCATDDTVGYGVLANNRQWDEIDKQLDTLMKNHNTIPAAYTVAGDVYTAVADDISPEGYGNFFIQYLRKNAIAAYENAQKLSTLPQIESSLATAYSNAGEYERAVKLLDGNDKALAVDATRSVYADALAHTGKFSQAAKIEAKFMSTYGKEQSNTVRTEIANGLGWPVTRTDNVRDVMLSPNCGAPGVLQDFTYIPEYRTITDVTLNSDENDAVDAQYQLARDGSWTLPKLSRAPENYIIYLLMAGEYSTAKQYCPGGDYSSSKLCLAVYSGSNTAPEGPFGDATIALVDMMQNLWRYYGQRDKAKETLEQSTSVSAAMLNDRLGEILFLDEDYAGAAKQFEQAAEGYQSNCYSFSGAATSPAWAKLRQATALRMAGNVADARVAAVDAESLIGVCAAALASPTTDNFMENERTAEQAYIKQEQAQNYYDQKQYDEAFDLATQAVPLRDAADADSVKKAVRGALEQLASVSAFAAGHYQAAEVWATKALVYDPKSPLYQEALADAKRALAEESGSSSSESADASDTGSSGSSDTSAEAGEKNDDQSSQKQSITNTDELMENYRDALQSNDSLFSSWNNLGVLQARQNDIDTAINSFERAVAAKPDYSLGWFNLGVAESRHASPVSFLRSQGAFGKAGSLDSELKNADREFVFDDNTYSTKIDVSKAIPENLQLAENLRSAPRMLTASLGLLVLGRIIMALAGDWITGKVSEDVTPLLDKIRKRIMALLRPLGGMNARRAVTADGSSASAPATTDSVPQPSASLAVRIISGPLLTMVVSFVSLIWISGASSSAEYVLAGVISLALLLMPAITAAWVGKNRDHIDHHRSFWPASVVTVVLTPFQLGFAPPSPIDASVDGKETACHKGRWGMGVLGVATIAMCVVAMVTSVPTIRMASATALVVIGSALTPVDPLDGAQIDLPKWLDWLITVAMTVTTIITAMNIL